MSNPIPNPFARPTEYAAVLAGAIVVALTGDWRVAIVPITACVVTFVVSWLERRPAQQEVDANPDDE